MKNKLVAGIILVGVLCFPGGLSWAEQEGEYYNQDMGVKFIEPRGWEQFQGMGELGPDRNVIVIYRNKDMNAAITLQFKKVPGDDFDLFEYATFQAGYKEAANINKVSTLPKKVRVGDQEAVVTLFEAEVSGEKIFIREYYFFDKQRNKVYHLSLESAERNFRRDSSDFSSVVSSFRFINRSLY